MIWPGTCLPSDTMKALDLVLHSEQTRKINLGVLHYHDKVHRFAVSSGIGYDAAICHQLCISRVKVFFNRLGLGKLAYAACSLYRLRRCQPDEMEILLDDTKRLHFKRVFFASALIFLMKVVDANSARMPNRMMICWTLL